MSAEQFLSLPSLGNTQVHVKLGSKLSEALLISYSFGPDTVACQATVNMRWSDFMMSCLSLYHKNNFKNQF